MIAGEKGGALYVGRNESISHGNEAKVINV